MKTDGEPIARTQKGKFVKGVSANPHGRPKGRRNKATRDLAEFFRSVLYDDDWQTTAREQLIAGTNPTLTKYALETVGGKPRDRVSLETSDGQPFGVLAVPMHAWPDPNHTAIDVSPDTANGNGNGNGAEH